MLLTRLCVLLLCLSVTLGERITVQVADGVLDPFTVAFVLIAAALWLQYDRGEGKPPPSRRGMAIITVGPLLVLLATLPLIGVTLGRYGITTLYAWIVPGFSLAILSLARAQRLNRIRLDQIGFVLILVEGLYGLCQTLFRLGLLPESVWGWAVEWDANSQLALSELYVISNRSTGLFINANSFGLWSCLAIVFSAVMLRRWQRGVGVVLSMLGVVGSQSRTAWLVLGLLALLLLVRALRNTAVAGRVVTWTLAATPIAGVVWLMGWTPLLVESNLVTRLTSGVRVVDEGVAADQNLQARVSAWMSAREFTADYPFGTFGPPEKLFGGFIDNEFVYLFLQGGLVLLVAYFLALCSPFVIARRGVPNATALGAASAVAAVFSFTMLPMESPRAAALVWLMAAASLGTWDTSAATLRGSIVDRFIESDFATSASSPADVVNEYAESTRRARNDPPEE